jgi:hypothetical protein
VANPAASSGLQLGNATVGIGGLGKWQALLGVAADPGEQEKHFDYHDFLVGDNLPVIITATTAISIDMILAYGIVTTANWPQE